MKDLIRIDKNSCKAQKANELMLQNINSTMILELVRIEKEVLGPFKEAQKEWFEYLKEKLFPAKNLFEFIDGKVLFKGKEIKPIKNQNSHSYLLIKALIKKSNEEGFVSYENIEEFFIENGLEPIVNNKRKLTKRISNARAGVYRFLGIEDELNGEPLIEPVSGKGLELHNPNLF